MQTVKLDRDNNLVIEQGNLSVISGQHALAQDVKTRTGLYKGENRFDTSEGIDYDNEMLGVFGGEEYYRQTLRNRILGNPEVENVTNVKLARSGTELTLTADVQSIYGIVEL